MRKYGRFIALLICAVMVITSFEGTTTFAKSRRTKKPTKVNHRTIKVKASKTSAKITFKKGKRASRYIVFYKAKNARKWESKTIKVKRSKTQKVTLYRLKKGTKYYVKIQGFKYKKSGKRWKRIRHRWRRVDRYKKVRGVKSRTVSFITEKNKINKDVPNITEKDYIEKCIKEDEKVTLKYGDAEIHLGQTWTEELKTQLEAGSDSEVKKLVRPKFIEFRYTEYGDWETDGIVVSKHKNLLDCDIYCYGTKSYNNFLRVNVVGDRILGWETNGEILGVVDGTEVKRGTVIDEYKKRGATSEIRKFDKTSKEWFGNLEEGATLIGGFKAHGVNEKNDKYEGEMYYEWHQDITEINKIKGELASNEKMIGFHYINAIRRLAGSDPLEYSKYLDGGNMTWQCTEEFIQDASRNGIPKLKEGDITRYGAQPEAETIWESINKGQDYDYIKHSLKKCEYGVLAGITGDEVSLLPFYASGKIVLDEGGNNGLGSDLGESVASQYFGNKEPDQKHSGSLLYPKHTKVGIGFCRNMHVENFSENH
ncbi:MAG: fibronectin type III domain-containing protein [Hornefia sp.]|nr:fibronectin type III domain-containing protein [Hornefia sp.]